MSNKHHTSRPKESRSKKSAKPEVPYQLSDEHMDTYVRGFTSEHRNEKNAEIGKTAYSTKIDPDQASFDESARRAEKAGSSHSDHTFQEMVDDMRTANLGESSVLTMLDEEMNKSTEKEKELASRGRSAEAPHKAASANQSQLPKPAAASASATTSARKRSRSRSKSLLVSNSDSDSDYNPQSKSRSSKHQEKPPRSRPRSGQKASSSNGHRQTEEADTLPKKNKSDKPYSCPKEGCNTTFSRKYEVDRHLEDTCKFRSKPKDPILCPFCKDKPSTYSRQDALGRHIKTSHKEKYEAWKASK
jgi:hypothetical protein